MKKKVLYKETAYLMGLLFLAIGNFLMAKADFGISMVVALAYLVLTAIVCAVFNSFAIAGWSKFLEQKWDIKDKWAYRSKFGD